MGIGDNIMATGLARGAKERGRRVALGDGTRIIWDGNSEIVFRGNPNLARPGEERSPDIDWVSFYKGNRLYNRQDAKNKRWIWEPFRPKPGEFFLSRAERDIAEATEPGFILVEPNVPWQKGCAPNKDWGFEKYQEVVNQLSTEYSVCQFAPRSPKDRVLAGAYVFPAGDFRTAVARLSRAALYIGTEGGLHHAAAAVNIDAVVIFGGFVAPFATGYEYHENLTGGADACGNYELACPHCRQALDAISVDEVVEAAKGKLNAQV